MQFLMVIVQFQILKQVIYRYNSYTDVDIKTKIDSLIANVNVSNYYNEVGIGDIDKGQPTFI